MAREICEIRTLETGPDGEATEEVSGRFILDNNKITFQPEGQGTSLMGKTLMATPAIVLTPDSQIEVTAEESPTLWFHNLPQTFHGTYLWAYMLDGTPEKEA